jgi:hypothetical protein
MSDMPEMLVWLTAGAAALAGLCALAAPVERWYMNRRTYNRWRK